MAKFFFFPFRSHPYPTRSGGTLQESTKGVRRGEEDDACKTLEISP